jgi:hypothetical protein
VAPNRLIPKRFDGQESARKVQENGKNNASKAGGNPASSGNGFISPRVYYIAGLSELLKELTRGEPRKNLEDKWDIPMRTLSQIERLSAVSFSNWQKLEEALGEEFRKVEALCPEGWGGIKRKIAPPRAQKGKGWPYKHLEIIHEFEIRDPQGDLAYIKTAERLKILHQVYEGGSLWTCRPWNLRAFTSYAIPPQSPWDEAAEVEVARIEKRSEVWDWDTYLDPPLLAGETVWQLASFQVKKQFTERKEHVSFHSMEAIGSFTWKIKFPKKRPAQEWWPTVIYHPSHPSNEPLESHHEKTWEITWSQTNLLKGVIYFMNWRW